MKSLVLISLILATFGLNSIYAQEKQVVMIRVNHLKKGTTTAIPGMIVYHPDNKVSIVEFEKKFSYGLKNDSYQEGDLKFKEELSKWINQGFTINSLSTSRLEDQDFILAILVKEP